MAQLILMPGKERSAFKQHHPWLFAGSVGRLEGRARPGRQPPAGSQPGRINTACAPATVSGWSR